MPQFTVMTRGKRPVVVEAASWITALGRALETNGDVVGLERLICEVLPDGSLMARDGQRRWIVQRLDGGNPRPVPRRAPFEPSEDEDSTDLQTPVSWVGHQQALAEQALAEGFSAQVEPAPAQRLGLEQITDAGTAVAAWEIALEMAQKVAPSESGVAVQVTPHEGLIIVGALGPHAQKLRAGRLPPGRGFVGHCIDKARPFIVNDARRDPRHYAEVDAQTGYRTRVVLCAPVIAEGLCFGCMELLNPPDDGRYERSMLDAVMPIMSTLGARLFRAGLRGRRV